MQVNILHFNWRVMTKKCFVFRQLLLLTDCYQKHDCVFILIKVSDHNDSICKKYNFYPRKIDGVNTTISDIYKTFFDQFRTNGSKIATDCTS